MATESNPENPSESLGGVEVSLESQAAFEATSDVALKHFLGIAAAPEQSIEVPPAAMLLRYVAGSLSRDQRRYFEGQVGKLPRLLQAVVNTTTAARPRAADASAEARLSQRLVAGLSAAARADELEPNQLLSCYASHCREIFATAEDAASALADAARLAEEELDVGSLKASKHPVAGLNARLASCPRESDALLQLLLDEAIALGA